VLTTGGHNAGIVSEPGHPHRSFRISTADHDDKYVDPVTWAARAEAHEGSWWLAWADWLAGKSSPDMVEPPEAGSERNLGPAPGLYVLG